MSFWTISAPPPPPSRPCPNSRVAAAGVRSPYVLAGRAQGPNSTRPCIGARRWSRWESRPIPPWLAQRGCAAAARLHEGRGRASCHDRRHRHCRFARNASAIGQKFTRRLAEDSGKHGGLSIASGLARGIDTAAHTAALETGTVAVLAGGIDSIYPPENEELHTRHRHPGRSCERNAVRLQASGVRIFRGATGSSPASPVVIVVVEAATRSGSLITARLAGELGREVFAVPGNPLDPRAEGTNRLLRDGAGLVTCADDVLQTLAPILGQNFTAPEADEDDKSQEDGRARETRGRRRAGPRAGRLRSRPLSRRYR